MNEDYRKDDLAEIPFISSLPDTATAEGIVFGKNYNWIKSVTWIWDLISANRYDKVQSLVSEIRDREFAYDVLTNNPNLLYARGPVTNDIEKAKDLMVLRDIIQTLKSAKRIPHFRKQNEVWARKQAVDQYVRNMGTNIPEATWKAATASYNKEPIDYNTVNNLVDRSDDHSEVTDWDHAMSLILGKKEYEAMLKNSGEDVPRMFRDPEPVVEEEPEDEEYDEYEEESEDEESVEEEESEDEPEEEISSLSEDELILLENMSSFIREWFGNPLGDIIRNTPDIKDDLYQNMQNWLIENGLPLISGVEDAIAMMEEC